MLRKKLEEADELIKKQNAQIQTMYQEFVKQGKGDQAEEEIVWEKAASLIKDSVGLSQADGVTRKEWWTNWKKVAQGMGWM